MLNNVLTADNAFHALSYTPVVSSFFNLGAIAAKYMCISGLENERVFNNRFIQLIDSRSYQDFFALAIPGISVIAGIYEFIFRNHHNRDTVLRWLENNEVRTSSIQSIYLLSDREFIKDALRLDQNLTYQMSDRFKDDADFMLELFEIAIRFDAQAAGYSKTPIS